MKSKHYAMDRSFREAIIKSLGGDGKELFRVNVDRGHPNGPEIHVITDNAIIIVYNQWSGRLVTKLIARPSQLLRYRRSVPAEVLQKAKAHEMRHLNY